MKHQLSFCPILLLLGLVACRPEAMPAEAESLGVASGALDLPELFTTESGQRVEQPSEWEAVRRPEILAQFQSQVYGRTPEDPVGIDFRLDYANEEALAGLAVAKSVTAVFRRGAVADSMNIFLYLPKAVPGPYPIFLGLNFYGNHTIHADPAIPITTNWVRNNTEFCIFNNRADAVSRGVRASRWPVERLIGRGYGLAVIYSGDIDPDFDDGFQNGVHALFKDRGRTAEDWGTLGAWAWGLSRGMDYLLTEPDVDPQKVMVIGHSRLGKAALWAGAQDERFAMVISNDSGCGGAALSRRKSGERLTDININFPHWFCENFRSYNGAEQTLPVDQHMLLALIAPRPVYVASAQGDDWADPYGEYLSLYFAAPVYKLYGYASDLAVEHPAVNEPVHSGRLGYHVRSGGHDITRYDWERFMDFADLFFNINL